MLDELTGLVQAKAGRPGTLADSSALNTVYGEAEAKWHAARAFIDETWRGVGDTIAGGGTLSHDQRTLTRLALYKRHVGDRGDQCRVVYRAAGTTALRAGPLQQYFRDMHAGTSTSRRHLVRSRTVDGRSPSPLRDTGGCTWISCPPSDDVALIRPGCGAKPPRQCSPSTG